MPNHKRISHPTRGFLTITLLILMYSFGTFGFLNLFGIREYIQASVIILIVSIMCVLHIKFKLINIAIVLLFLFSWAAGGVIYGGYFTRPIESLLILYCIVVLSGAPSQYVLTFARILVIATSFICSLVAVAYIFYTFYPELYDLANHNIYSSEVGADRIYPAIAIDWLSFTSGDGFQFQGQNQIRLKGYSNEPSSTIVHYLAPAVLAFYLGGKYIYLGVFIILINLIAIGSMVAYIVIAFSIAIYVVLFYFSHYAKLIIYLLVLALCVMLVQPDFVKNLFISAGTYAIDSVGLDLIARKVGDGSDNTSLGERLVGITDGLYYLFISPVGYSFELLGSGAGLLYVISASCGWFGVLVLFWFMRGFLFNLLQYSENDDSGSNQYANALTMSLLVVLFLISGYGWDRPPGIIVLLTIYRVLSIGLQKFVIAKV